MDPNITINEVVQRALNFWERTLSARRSPNRRLLIPSGCVEGYSALDGNTGRRFCMQQCSHAKCTDYKVPNQFTAGCFQGRDGSNLRRVTQDGPGFAPNEFVMFVDSVNKGSCRRGVTVAFASPCEMHPTTDRPIMGAINFCPQHMSVNEPAKTKLISTATHEVAHALGFTSKCFALMRDVNGNPRTPRDPMTKKPRNGQPSENTVRQINRPWVSAVGTFRKTFTSLVTPRVLEEGRRHFNCPNLDGIDLENEGGQGTAGTHFEKRVVGDEIMAGSTGLRGIVSRLTLAYFQDSGGRSIEPYCEESSTYMCYHRKAYGQCTAQNMNRNLPPSDQYFRGNPNKGGAAELVDSCPIAQISCSGGLKIIVNGQPFPCQSGVARIQTNQITGEAICPHPNEVCGVRIICVKNISILFLLS
ncbi:unnamed protein product [Trichobilharzia regenti]|nr:unnamed protein product [Trichobilharzia regenti]